MTVELLKELIDKYNQCREEWILRYGNDEGFNDWFTKQVMK